MVRNCASFGGDCVAISCARVYLKILIATSCSSASLHLPLLNVSDFTLTTLNALDSTCT